MLCGNFFFDCTDIQPPRPLKFNCELCGGKTVGELKKSVPRHMREAHPGCSKPTDGRGYNEAGHYCSGWSGYCGDGGIGTILILLFNII